MTDINEERVMTLGVLRKLTETMPDNVVIVLSLEDTPGAFLPITSMDSLSDVKTDKTQALALMFLPENVGTADEVIAPFVK